MENNFLNKRKGAAMTAMMLVSVIILAIGFILLLILYSQFLFTQEIDKEVCHESVLARHTFNVGGLFEPGRTSIPLRCKTEKICFERGGEDCEYVFGEEKDDNIITSVEINTDEDKAKTDILDTLANAMYDCHSMLGEGKLNFAPAGWEERPYCVLCSRLALDNVSKEEIGKIDASVFYNLLALKKDADGQSYLKYLYGVDKPAEMNEKLLQAERQGMNFDIKIGKENVILVKLVRDSTWESILAGTGIAALGLGLAPFTGGLSLGLVVAGAGAAGGTTAFVALHPSDNDYRYLGPYIVSYNKETLEKEECYSFEASP